MNVFLKSPLQLNHVYQPWISFAFMFTYNYKYKNKIMTAWSKHLNSIVINDWIAVIISIICFHSLVDIDVFQDNSGLGLIYSKCVGSNYIPRKWLRISTKYKHFNKSSWPKEYWLVLYAVEGKWGGYLKSRSHALLWQVTWTKTMISQTI